MKASEDDELARTLVGVDDLLAAHDWVNSGANAGLRCDAYVDRRTGSIHWVGDEVEEDLPDDVDDDRLYVAVPHRSEFDLGRSLALRFAEEQLPQHLDEVEAFFRGKGAYARFRSLLVRIDRLDAWRRYEGDATKEALRGWCDENGFELVG